MMQTASKIKQTMQAIRTAANPQAAMNAMLMNNPQMKQVMDIVQKYGGDPMAAFRAEAEAAGFNPEEILGMIR